MRAAHLKTVMAFQGRRVECLADLAGISRTYASELLNAQKTCTGETADRIANVLHVPVGLLFEFAPAALSPAQEVA